MSAGASISVVVPIYNEEGGLQQLFDRLYPVLDQLGRPYEVVYVDDGSADRSVALLREQFTRRPDTTRVVVLARNVGQHMAIMAGFAQTRGDYVVTIDADLQNPPEEIAAIVAAMDAGADYVGTVRRNRHDALWRKAASRLMNHFREQTTQIRITDQGCMLRGYDRAIVNAINSCVEVSTFVPALGYTFARNPVEIEVAHAERMVGKSKYSVYRLIRLNFDLMTGFSVMPLQFFSMSGMAISLVSLVGFILLAIRRLVHGPEAEGLFTLFAIAFFLIGVLLMGVGVVGEYVGRIYEQVRQRPRYTVAALLERNEAAAPGIQTLERQRPAAHDVAGARLSQDAARPSLGEDAARARLGEDAVGARE